MRVAIAAALCLWGVGASAAEASIEPPPGPEGDTSVTNPSGEGIGRCWAFLRDTTVKIHARVDRTLITASPTLGLVFRADFTSLSNPPVRARFVCLTSSPGAVLISFDQSTRPLTSGPWGQVSLKNEFSGSAASQNAGKP